VQADTFYISMNTQYKKERAPALEMSVSDNSFKQIKSICDTSKAGQLGPERFRILSYSWIQKNESLHVTSSG